ncbi:Putative zinc-finger [Amycolatopsis xylanica]|uniref:Putative zinc-finger n=1 Tax=Amycolatopsis xylanica TaxID=589385 RepID=A0A1H3RWE4_9PSEU|nr:zf-HC2 domain-containing protein [Amycolatopsis xylanica]SDZ30043.1 Putative zinc-finger [Amycolatopsis xylanica]
MSAIDHDHAPLGAYVLGALDENESREFEAHLATCDACRREADELNELRVQLDEVPPEAFLDGPPEGGDLLLQRTLRSVRAAEEALTGTPRRPKRFLALAGAAALVVVALGGGVLVGRQTAPEGTNPPVAIPTTSAVPGTKTLAGTDGSVKLAATVTPAAGWIRVHAKVDGVHAGEKCQLIVMSKAGEAIIAGSWVVSAKGEKDGTGLDGSALVPADQVASVDVVTTDGRKLVSASA